MERLTRKDAYGYVHHPWEFNGVNGSYDIFDEDLLAKQIDRLSAYEDTGMEPEEIERIVDAYGRGHTLRTESAERLEIVREIKENRLRELVQAETEGQLVMLPCKVGATVYGHSKAEVSEYKVAVISLATYNWYLRCQNNNSDFWVTDADIGKTVFLTREEAEASMREDTCHA